MGSQRLTRQLYENHRNHKWPYLRSDCAEPYQGRLSGRA